MLEPLDLDALEHHIRWSIAEFGAQRGDELCLDLIAELRATRAELRDSGYVAGIHQPVVAAEWKARAERAEATIARALELADGPDHCVCWRMAAALRGHRD